MAATQPNPDTGRHATWGARALRVGLLALGAAILAACGSDDEGRGSVSAVQQTATLPKAAIDAASPGLSALVGAPAKCNVTQHKITYGTVDPRGNAVNASAGLYLPSDCAGPYPVLVYHHGTTVTRAFTMSDPTNGEAGLQLGVFAAQGYVVVMPDYLGYGDSTLGYHPYLHAENTAAVSIDALRAARRVLGEKGVSVSSKLFLAGYSQGGHSAMATHRAMERDFPGEFTVTASVPMAGPYDLERTFLDGIASPGQGATVFTPMVFVGYQKAYGDVYTKPEDVFQSPWVNGIESLLPGTLGFTELYTTGKLPLTMTGAGGLLTDGFVSGFATNPAFPMRKRVAQNGLLDWKPKGVVGLCMGARDPVVPVRNMTSAVSWFASQGVQVTAVDVEQVPAFAPVIAAQLAGDPYLTTYHGTVVPPLCTIVAKSNFFDPLK